MRTVSVGDFTLLSSAPKRAVIRAAGRRVAVTPAAGACVSDDAIDISAGSAFLLLTDCVLVAADPSAGIDPVGDSLGQEPFAGLVTISVAAGPRGSVESLQRFVESAEGRRRLARGAGDDEIEIANIARLGDALYVHAISSGNGAVPLLSRDFWRGFLDLNGRMAVLTVSGFQASGLGPEALFAEARRQARALIEGNRALGEEAIIARLTDTSPARPQSARESAPSTEVAELPPAALGVLSDATPTAGADLGTGIGAIADLGEVEVAAGADASAGTAGVAAERVAAGTGGAADLLPPRRPSNRLTGSGGAARPVPSPAAGAGSTPLPPRRPGG
ncbi:MAG: hypothetical protein AAF899_16330 [Pseudomonadota bacterium]